MDHYHKVNKPTNLLIRAWMLLTLEVNLDDKSEWNTQGNDLLLPQFHTEFLYQQHFLWHSDSKLEFRNEINFKEFI